MMSFNIAERRKLQKGFSTVELVVALAVMLIVTAVALPNFVRVYRNYQLNSASAKMANILKQTRSEAIRRNRQVICRVAGPAGATSAWADLDGSTTVNANEPQASFAGGTVAPVPAAGVPGTAALAGSIGAGVTLTAVSPTGGSVTFDSRGATTVLGVYAFYLANPGQATWGYRAVILLPSGSVQEWAADGTGAWHWVN